MPSIQIIDQRETDNRIVIVIHDPPAEVTQRHVDRLTREIRQKFADHIPTRATTVTINKIRALVADGTLTRAQADALLL